VAVLGWQPDDEQHLPIALHADPAELEAGERRTQVRTEPVRELVGLRTASDTARLALLRADHQHGVALEVPRCVLGQPVRTAQEKLDDLHQPRLRRDVHGALGFEIPRLRRITIRNDVIQNGPQNALAQRHDIRIHPPTSTRLPSSCSVRR
jgi:hypothetical protein